MERVDLGFADLEERRGGDRRGVGVKMGVATVRVGR